MGPIDIQTVIILLFFGNFIALMLFLAHPPGIKREKMDYYYISGRLLQCVGWFSIALHESIFDWIPFSTGDLMLVTGLALELIAMEFIILPSSKWFFRALIFVPCLAVINKLNPFDMTMNRFIGSEAVIFALLFLVAGIAIIVKWNISLVIQRITGLIYIACSSVFILRFFFFFFMPAGEHNRAAFDVHVFTFLVFFIALMTGTAGYILLKKEKTERDLLLESRMDFLTGVYNRRGFEADAGRYISLAGRISIPLSMLMIDIDNFGKINRKYGHSTGDDLLRNFAHAVKGIIRGYDLVCRYSGEEFVVLLPDTTPDIAHNVAERIRTYTGNSAISGRPGLRFSVSIGVVSAMPENTLSVERMYNESEGALHRAKKAGKNRVCVSKL